MATLPIVLTLPIKIAVRRLTGVTPGGMMGAPCGVPTRRFAARQAVTQ